MKLRMILNELAVAILIAAALFLPVIVVVCSD